MVKSITTSSCRIHFNFTNVDWPSSIFSHSYSDVLSKQSRTTEEGNTFSLGNTEATATQGIGDHIIYTCMTETNQKGCLDSGVIFFTLRLFYSRYTIPLWVKIIIKGRLCITKQQGLTQFCQNAFSLIHLSKVEGKNFKQNKSNIH